MLVTGDFGSNNFAAVSKLGQYLHSLHVASIRSAATAYRQSVLERGMNSFHAILASRLIDKMNGLPDGCFEPKTRHNAIIIKTELINIH